MGGSKVTKLSTNMRKCLHSHAPFVSYLIFLLHRYKALEKAFSRRICCEPWLAVSTCSCKQELWQWLPKRFITVLHSLLILVTNLWTSSNMCIYSTDMILPCVFTLESSNFNWIIKADTWNTFCEECFVNFLCWQYVETMRLGTGTN